MNAKIKIISETADFIVIDKPMGLTIHNENTKEPSVLTVLGGKLLPVHRIDKETSGVLVLAKNPQAAAHLAEQFQNHTIRKIYCALLRGPLKAEKIAWSWPLSDKAEGRKNPQGLSRDRKNCQSEVSLIKANNYMSLVEVDIKTGRQHQIRKHAAIAKHAIIGDPRYNDLKYNKMIADRYKIDRMFLHASLLEFDWQGKKMTFESLLPIEFKKLL